MSTAALRAVAPAEIEAAAPTLLQVVAPESITPERAHLPHPTEWTARMARALIEAVAGERPVTQLTKWTTREVLLQVTVRAAAARRHPAGKALASPLRRVGSVRICVVAPGIVEACAVVSGMTRARAIALRLEARDQRWIVTAMELG
jgi:hypothetical protein